ncbi:3-deoxy-D-manno-octulosonate 8-phosphate phosphatase [Saprospira sp. CCB-QB6]|uniref:KdsC family phosphatase n=1 Tax=Saprospira sp. CCB-QB6 TaxID=3023936 RepID=UPI00234A7E96|nr:3-deoxy-D-manno-octulosonate 8-phosphate phosphatase [Saprospira sp. CCB-QB6]WCL81706.1 3-deoxy-D-manno-octulosonate 8-phosphate phosphatase [Saprospira sp. CCB-QB6]
MSFLNYLSEIKTFIFDVDGVFTNGELLVQEDGRLLRSMNVKDGFAFKLALEKGYDIFIITGGRSEGVWRRFEGLGLPAGNYFAGQHDKLSCIRELIEAERINLDHCLYMGDDLPDYAPMRLVALACCPADAVPEIQAVSQYVSPKKGGMGCVRDVIERVLKVQDQWPQEKITEL